MMTEAQIELSHVEMIKKLEFINELIADETYSKRMRKLLENRRSKIERELHGTAPETARAE